MVQMVYISIVAIALMLSGCATTKDSSIDINSLKDKGGNGLQEAYEDALSQGKSDSQAEYITGLRKHRVYDLSEPGVPVRQPAKTRTYWVAPRTGDVFATHGGWITVIVEKEGFVGSPLRGKYVSNDSFTGKKQIQSAARSESTIDSLKNKIEQTLQSMTQ